MTDTHKPSIFIETAHNAVAFVEKHAMIAFLPSVFNQLKTEAPKLTAFAVEVFSKLGPIGAFLEREIPSDVITRFVIAGIVEAETLAVGLLTHKKVAAPPVDANVSPIYHSVSEIAA